MSRNYSFDSTADNSFQSVPLPRIPSQFKRGGYGVQPGSSHEQSQAQYNRPSSPPSPIRRDSGAPANAVFQHQQYSPERTFPQDEQRRMSAYRMQRQEEAQREQETRPAPVPFVAPAPPPPSHFSSSPYRDNPTHEDTSYYGAGAVTDPLTAAAAGASGAIAYNHARSYSHDSNLSTPYDPHPNTLNYYPNTSYSSTTGLAAAATGPGQAATDFRSNNLLPRGRDVSPQPPGASAYRDASPARPGNMGAIDIEDIEDDDDPFSEATARDKKRSWRGSKAAGLGAGAAAGAGAGGFLSKISPGSRDASGQYGAVPGGPNGAAEAGGLGAAGGGGGGGRRGFEKSEWLKSQTSKGKRIKWMVGGLIVLVIVLAIVGGTVGAVIANKNASNASNASADGGSGDNYDKNSPQVKSLLGNSNLHKVFPGFDYTPLNAQYPDCLKNPPSANNVTLDMAMLSQLTSTVRLYGTDCNQTELVLHAIEALDIQSTMKVWMGVWLGNNQTTNERQLNQMYDIFDKYGADQFAGVIVGNEVLFRKDLTETQLASQLSTVRANLKKKGISLPVATSDLGSNWTPTLAQESDIIMSNIHPFFGGVPADQASSWTYTFWQNNDVAAAKEGGVGSKPQIIAETGWPSSGGNDCGPGVKCSSSTAGSVAGIDEMNTFLDGWVCDALTNKTNYFWFEAFDEPWKIIFDKNGENWEDQWGIMDINRNLKDGVKIPDCGGKTWSA